jgi:hypothetical protein
MRAKTCPLLMDQLRADHPGTDLSFSCPPWAKTPACSI